MADQGTTALLVPNPLGISHRSHVPLMTHRKRFRTRSGRPSERGFPPSYDPSFLQN